MHRLSIAQAIGLVVSTAEAHRPRAVGFSPVVCPRLKVAYCPRLHSPPPAPAGADRGEPFWRVEGSGLPRGAGPGAGLVGCAEFGNRDVPPRRYGLNGLTANGRRRLQQGCSLLEEQRSLLSFWTITLPDHAMWEVIDRDLWPRFQQTIRHRLHLALRRAGLPPLALAVAEIHPSRSGRMVQAMPHLHVLFRGRKGRRDAWAFSPRDLDRIIVAALKACGIVVEEVKSAGNVQSIRRSVRRYLSKYVSKASHVFQTEMEPEGLGSPNGCPRQWWFMTRELLALVLEATGSLPAPFLAWLCDRARPAARGQLYVVQRVPIPDPRAPSVWLVSFRSPWALFLCWEAYEKAVILGPDPSRPTVRHDRLKPQLHSFQHQHLREAGSLGRPGAARHYERPLCERHPE